MYNKRVLLYLVILLFSINLSLFFVRAYIPADTNSNNQSYQNTNPIRFLLSFPSGAAIIPTGNVDPDDNIYQNTNTSNVVNDFQAESGCSGDVNKDGKVDSADSGLVNDGLGKSGCVSGASAQSCMVKSCSEISSETCAGVGCNASCSGTTTNLASRCSGLSSVTGVPGSALCTCRKISSNQCTTSTGAFGPLWGSVFCLTSNGITCTAKTGDICKSLTDPNVCVSAVREGICSNFTCSGSIPAGAGQYCTTLTQGSCTSNPACKWSARTDLENWCNNTDLNKDGRVNASDLDIVNNNIGCENNTGGETIPNQKDMGKYVPNEVFLISDSEWKNIFSFIPLTAWLEGGRYNEYKFLVYKEDAPIYATERIEHPSIYRDSVVFSSDKGGDLNVYEYNIKTGEQKLISSDVDNQEKPVVYGSQIAYEDDRGGIKNIYLHEEYDDSYSCSPSCEKINVNPVQLSECQKADINADGQVDQADYTAWFNWYGARCNLANNWCNGSDMNRDGGVDQADYSTWFNNYGAKCMGVKLTLSSIGKSCVSHGCGLVCQDSGGVSATAWCSRFSAGDCETNSSYLCTNETGTCIPLKNCDEMSSDECVDALSSDVCMPSCNGFSNCDMQTKRRCGLNGCLWNTDNSAECGINGCMSESEEKISYGESPSLYKDQVVYQDDRNGNWQIYLKNITSDESLFITSGVSNKHHPSIYGNLIVYQDDRNGNWDIYSYNLDTGIETRLTFNEFNQMNPVLYGNLIVYQDDRNGNWDVYILNLSSNIETRIAGSLNDEENPSIYGNKIVWQEDATVGNRIHLFDFSTSLESVLNLQNVSAGQRSLINSYSTEEIGTILRESSSTRVTLIGNPSPEIADILVAAGGAGLDSSKIRSISIQDYFSYWMKFENVVYSANDYASALSSSVYGVEINAPVVIDNGLLWDYGVLSNKNVSCVGQVLYPEVCDSNLDLSQVYFTNYYFPEIVYQLGVQR